MSSISEDTDPSESRAVARAAPAASPPPNRVTFNRLELNRILNLYGRMVADGEWRDYAIDLGRDKAVFSVFRRASEVPLFRIEKAPKLARKQGASRHSAPISQRRVIARACSHGSPTCRRAWGAISTPRSACAKTSTFLLRYLAAPTR